MSTRNNNQTIQKLCPLCNKPMINLGVFCEYPDHELWICIQQQGKERAMTLQKAAEILKDRLNTDIQNTNTDQNKATQMAIQALLTLDKITKLTLNFYQKIPFADYRHE